MYNLALGRRYQINLPRNRGLVGTSIDMDIETLCGLLPELRNNTVLIQVIFDEEIGEKYLAVLAPATLSDRLEALQTIADAARIDKMYTR